MNDAERARATESGYGELREMAEQDRDHRTNTSINMAALLNRLWGNRWAIHGVTPRCSPAWDSTYSGKGESIRS